MPISVIIEIHGSDNIIPLVETYVEGNTLIIKFKKNVGKAVQATYSIAGSGNIQAAELEAEYTDASINGPGNISCHASQKLVACVRGSGDIAYKGNPQEVDAPRKNIRAIK